MDSLPTEILDEIVSLLPLDAINNLALCNTKFNQLCKNERLWEMMYDRDYGWEGSRRLKISWYEKYKIEGESYVNINKLYAARYDNTDYYRKYCEKVFCKLRSLIAISEQKSNKYKIYYLNTTRYTYENYKNKIGVIANNKLVASILLIMIYDINDDKEMDFIRKSYDAYADDNSIEGPFNNRVKFSLTKLLKGVIEKFFLDNHQNYVDEIDINESGIFEIWSLGVIEERLFAVL